MAAHDIDGASQILSRARVLDGATGRELERRGVACALPLWSAHALLDAPAEVRASQRDYAQAGAGARAANTFRTQPHALARPGLAAHAPLASGLRSHDATRPSSPRARGLAPATALVWLGGCCSTTPAHIAALAARLDAHVRASGRSALG